MLYQHILSANMEEENLKHIKFQNRQNVNAQFDLIRLEKLFLRNHMDHSIEAHHKVEFYVILLIEKGKGYHTIDFTDYPCSKGTLLTVRKDQVQKFFRNKDLKGTVLLFTDEFLVSYLEKAETRKTMLLFNELLGVPKLQLNNTCFKSISQNIKRIEHEYFTINDDYSLGLIRSELHILITKLFRIKAQEEHINFEKKYLKEFIEFQNLVERKVTKITKVQYFANEMGLSTKTLNTITRSVIHKSAKEFVDEICTKQIKRLLINTNLSVKEIAYQSGFEETTNFYKYFKRQTQTTPEQFRVTN